MSSRAGIWRTFLGGAALLAGLGLAGQGQAVEPVDVELVLAVDVSLSMSPDELAIQRDGYVAALTDQRVIDAIRSGMHGKIAATYVEWAGAATQHVVVPWTSISTREEAVSFASKLSAMPPNSARRTSISSMLAFGGDLFAESGFRGFKRVIDISGDGPNNQGAPVKMMRDRVLEQGIIINGLPLMTNGGLASPYDVTELDRYYQDCVIGGPGSFLIPVNDWSQFPEAIRRKLVLELAGPGSPEWNRFEAEQPPVWKAQAEGSFDCLIGERLWRDRSWRWEKP